MEQQFDYLQYHTFLEKWQNMTESGDAFLKDGKKIAALLGSSSRCSYADQSKANLLPADDPGFAADFAEKAKKGLLFWNDFDVEPYCLKADENGHLTFSKEKVTDKQFTEMFPPQGVEKPVSPGFFSWAGHYFSKLFGGKGNKEVNDYLDKKEFYDACVYYDQRRAFVAPKKPKTVENWERGVMATAYLMAKDTKNANLHRDNPEFQKIYKASKEDYWQYAAAPDAQDLFETVKNLTKKTIAGEKMSLTEQADLMNKQNKLGLNIHQMRGENSGREIVKLSKEERAALAKKNYENLEKHKIEAIYGMINQELDDTRDARLHNQMRDLVYRKDPQVINLLYGFSQKMPEMMDVLRQQCEENEEFNAQKFIEEVAAGNKKSDERMTEMVTRYKQEQIEEEADSLEDSFVKF